MRILLEIGPEGVQETGVIAVDDADSARAYQLLTDVQAQLRALHSALRLSGAKLETVNSK